MSYRKEIHTLFLFYQINQNETEKRYCKCGCGSDISHKHPNAKFLNQRHKDKFHNSTNPGESLLTWVYRAGRV